MTFHTLNGQWVGDFWEHSAVVRELATRPFSPDHPQLLADLPHAFYSPYHLGIALISKLVDLDPVVAFSAAGLVNLTLLLISLNKFVSLLLNREGVGFYAWLFILLLWGDSPWGYSGFFHLQVLGYVLPYPATFASAITFMALAMYICLVRSENRLWLLPILVVAILVLLTHPLTFIVMFIGLVSISVGVRSLPLINYVLLICVFAISLLAAAAWPYFSFAELVLSESSVYHPSNCSMYVKVARRIFPALIGLPLVLLRIKSNWRDPLGLMVFALTLVYVYGALSSNWSYGRVISYIVCLLHIVIADRVSYIESKLELSQSLLPRLAYSGLILIILFPLSFGNGIRPVLDRSMSGQPGASDRYRFLSDLTQQYDVVLSDIETGRDVPTFGGKVVAVPHPLAFVPDHEIRKKDVRYFFSDVAFHDARLEIIKRYKVDFLLLNKDRVPKWETVMHSFQPLGSVVFSNDEFVLIDLHSLNKASASWRLLEYPLLEQPTDGRRPLHSQVVRFGDEIELLGYDLDTSDARPGGVVHITLYLHALRPMDASYTVFVHLLDTMGEMRGQKDGRPLNGAYSTEFWPSTTVVRDEYTVPVKDDAPPGEYRLAMGLYQSATMKRLPAFNEQGVALASDRLMLYSRFTVKQ